MIRGAAGRTPCRTTLHRHFRKLDPTALAAALRTVGATPEERGRGEQRVAIDGRDVSFAEDASSIHCGHGPSICSLLRSAALSLLRRDGHQPVTARLRYHGQFPHQAVALLLQPFPTRAWALSGRTPGMQLARTRAAR